MKKHKRATRDQLCRRGGFRQEGMPLTQRDHALLQPLIDKANELGYTPLVSDGSSACRIKGRFRCWKDALKAAGLPSEKEPEQVKNVRKPKTTGSSQFEAAPCLLYQFIIFYFMQGSVIILPFYLDIVIRQFRLGQVRLAAPTADEQTCMHGLTS